MKSIVAKLVSMCYVLKKRGDVLFKGNKMILFFRTIEVVSLVAIILQYFFKIFPDVLYSSTLLVLSEVLWQAFIGDGATTAYLRLKANSHKYLAGFLLILFSIIILTTQILPIGFGTALYYLHHRVILFVTVSILGIYFVAHPLLSN